jgi:uncharacterized protein YjbJ (UPF0337 family)
MNIDILAGEGTELKGKFKEGLGKATGDSALRQEGIVDQISGNVRKVFGELRDFAREQPVAAAVVIAMAGFALLGSRGKRRQ